MSLNLRRDKDFHRIVIIEVHHQKTEIIFSIFRHLDDPLFTSFRISFIVGPLNCHGQAFVPAPRYVDAAYKAATTAVRVHIAATVAVHGETGDMPVGVILRAELDAHAVRLAADEYQRK